MGGRGRGGGGLMLHMASALGIQRHEMGAMHKQNTSSVNDAAIIFPV
jgi:hypothetical protein